MIYSWSACGGYLELAIKLHGIPFEFEVIATLVWMSLVLKWGTWHVPTIATEKDGYVKDTTQLLVRFDIIQLEGAAGIVFACVTRNIIENMFFVGDKRIYII